MECFCRDWHDEQPRGFPTAFYSARRRSDNNAATQCLLVGIASGTCVQDELRSLNILEDPRPTPFSTGRLNQTGVQLSGGNEGVRYFIAADFSGAQSLVPPEGSRSAAGGHDLVRMQVKVVGLTR